MKKIIPYKAGRLLSLDVMRGLIMIFLAAEACSVWESIKALHPTGFAARLLGEFFHHPWHGLHLWDLIQPAFMTMAGTGMCIAYLRRREKGVSWKQNFRHIAFRSLKLFLLGTGLHCVYAGHLVWELWNVLTQLSVTTLIAYLIIDLAVPVQFGISLLLLLLTDVLYRTVLVPGFDQPFVEYHNFGSYVDTLLMNKINRDGWVTINFIPTAAHTIWGVLAGKLLLSRRRGLEKVRILVLSGLAGLVLGFGLDWANITPIIKRIATSSFTLASGGWVMLLLGLLYWLVDVKQMNRYAWIAVAVGMNSIFIYLFFETVGNQWFNGAVGIFVKGFAAYTGIAAGIAAVVSAVITWMLEWAICVWLARRSVFIKV